MMGPGKGLFNLYKWWEKNHPLEKGAYHTLLIMSSTTGKKIIQFSYPVFLCWVLSVISVGMLYGLGTGTWSVYQNYKTTIRANCLERENQLTQVKMEDQKQEIKYLCGQLKKLQDQAVYIQNYLGLNPTGTDKAKGKIGQGGGGVSEQFSPQPLSSHMWKKQTIPSVPDEVQPIQISHQNISRLDKDLEQIIVSLEKRQYELEYTPSICPVAPHKSWISCGYGMRDSPFTGKRQFHAGIDIAGWKGTPVMAPAKGKVYFVRNWGSMGLTIKIKHNSTYHTTYGHLLKAAVKKGQAVNRGEIIGYMGNSGRSTGYHLHYEIKKNNKRIDPFSYMVDWNSNRAVLAAGDK